MNKNIDRFKFRVWDNENKLYDNDGFLLDGRKGILVAVGDFTIEQCTGLRDKNDRLIYEGDVIAVSPDSEKLIVCWQEGKFIAKYEDYANDFFGRCADCYIIVGNIHEGKFKDCAKVIK